MGAPARRDRSSHCKDCGHWNWSHGQCFETGRILALCDPGGCNPVLGGAVAFAPYPRSEIPYRPPILARRTRRTGFPACLGFCGLPRTISASPCAMACQSRSRMWASARTPVFTRSTPRVRINSAIFSSSVKIEPPNMSDTIADPWLYCNPLTPFGRFGLLGVRGFHRSGLGVSQYSAVRRS